MDRSCVCCSFGISHLGWARCRCRVLYQKYLEWAPSSCSAWSRFAEMECSLGEVERARGIYELAIAQDLLDMPEVQSRNFPPPSCDGGYI